MACGLDPSIFRRFLQCIQVDKDEEVLMIRDKVSIFCINCEVCLMHFMSEALCSFIQICVQCTLRGRCFTEELVSTRQSLQLNTCEYAHSEYAKYYFVLDRSCKRVQSFPDT